MSSVTVGDLFASDYGGGIGGQEMGVIEWLELTKRSVDTEINMNNSWVAVRWHSDFDLKLKEWFNETDKQKMCIKEFAVLSVSRVFQLMRVIVSFCLQKNEWTWDESKMMVMQDPIYRWGGPTFSHHNIPILQLIFRCHLQWFLMLYLMTLAHTAHRAFSQMNINPNLINNTVGALEMRKLFLSVPALTFQRKRDVASLWR